jgi:ferredoxin--NADP+ reductase
MTQIGTEAQPLRVAIVGAGPTGFYTAEHLFRNKEVVVTVDMFERLPTPYGLVRYGVAPDHPKIKSVTKLYDRTADNPRFRFFGNVNVGEDISVEEMLAHYHQIVFTTGAETDRPMNIPGIDLKNSHSAREFVAWYNGHPDYVDYEFDLTQERAAVIGVGNVAMDVARILCRTTEELATTDIADYALEALSHSKVREVFVLGRRGPVQAAFTTPEVKELGEMADTDVVVLADEAELDALSEADLTDSADRATRRKVDVIQSYVGKPLTGAGHRLHLRFLVSPTELYSDDAGRVVGMKLVHNELYRTESGTLRPRQIDKFEDLTVGLVFRSIGYRGVPIPGVPFHDSWGIIHNQEGRVIVPESREPVLGLYTAGWIKRGPTGIIGTNKPDALETVKCMLADLAEGRVRQPARPEPEAIDNLIYERQPHCFRYADWLKVKAEEIARGEAQNRPKVKFTSVDEMLAVLEK